MYNELSTDTTELIDPLMQKLKKEKELAREYQQRKHDDWNENYELYRNHVRTNRLTQRQAVNIPMMKETINTLLSKIDEVPVIDWKERSGDEEKELIFQEIWNDWANKKNIEGIDTQDKKTTLLYGRPHLKLNWKDGGVDIQALDIYDVVIDPMVDPLDIETARYVIHQNIFRSLQEILADKRYSQEGKDKLKTWVLSKDGVVSSGKNREEWEKRMDRIKSMGLEADKLLKYGAGDVIVNITEHISHIWDEDKEKFEKRVIVYADDSVPLLNEPLKDVMGVDFYPYITWASDIETQDYWADAVADIVRTPNKIMNIWFSQLVENRTLKNFQMHWYDATIQGYQPQTYEPGAGRMLPAPGNPKDTIMPVQVDGLDDTMGAINFLTNIVERSTSATAIEKGSLPEGEKTLGEVKIAAANAVERAVTITKFYRRSRYELATKWAALMQANSSKSITLYKSGTSGKLYKKQVAPKDWKSEAGYEPTVRSSSEQEADATRGIQKFLFVQQQFPNNRALARIAQRRELEILDLSAAELREVEEEQKQNEEMAQKLAQMQLQQGQVPPEAQQAAPMQPAPAPMGQPMAAEGPGMGGVDEGEVIDLQNIVRRIQQINEMS